MNPAGVIESYRSIMRQVHGDQVADHVGLEYNKGYYKLSLPLLLEDGSIRQLRPRGLRLWQMIESIYRLSARYAKENRQMIPIIRCSLSALIDSDTKVGRFPFGELHIISNPLGIKFVWIPSRQGTFNESVVAYFCHIDGTLGDLLALVANLSGHEGVAMYHLHITPIGESVPRYSLDIEPQEWPHFVKSITQAVP